MTEKKFKRAVITMILTVDHGKFFRGMLFISSEDLECDSRALSLDAVDYGIEHGYIRVVGRSDIVDVIIYGFTEDFYKSSIHKNIQTILKQIKNL